MNPVREKQLRGLLTLTEEILESAKHKQWDDVMKKEQYRRKMVKEIFNQDPVVHEHQSMEDLVRQIIALNAKVITIAESSKLEILKKMHNLSTGQQAIDAYANHSD